MYGAALFGLVKRIVLDEQRAQDIMQEAFVKIWYNFDKYDRAKGRLFTWMLNLTRNLAIDYARSVTNRRTQQLDEIDEYNARFISIEPYYEQYDRDSVHLSLNILKPIEKSVMELLYYKGLTQVEVADELNIPLGTVKMHARLALIKLKGYFANDLNGKSSYVSRSA